VNSKFYVPLVGIVEEDVYYASGTKGLFQVALSLRDVPVVTSVRDPTYVQACIVANVVYEFGFEVPVNVPPF
jgi:hypothetical protein